MGSKIKNKDMLSALVSGDRSDRRSSKKCSLGYPQRFFAAVMFAGNAPAHVIIDDETRLLLYALFQQTTEGANNSTRPWGPFASALEQAKWDAWEHCGDMKETESARLYVVTLENACPDWWDHLTHNNSLDQVKWVREQVQEMCDIYNEKQENEKAIDEVKTLTSKVSGLTNEAQKKIYEKELEMLKSSEGLDEKEEEELTAKLQEEYQKALVPDLLKSSDVMVSMKRRGKDPEPDSSFKSKLDDEIARLEELLQRNAEHLNITPSRVYEADGPPIEHLKPSEDVPLSVPRTEAVKSFTCSRVHLLGLDKTSDKTEATPKYCSTLPQYRMDMSKKKRTTTPNTEANEEEEKLGTSKEKKAPPVTPPSTPSYLSSAVSMFSYFGSAAAVVEKEDAEDVPKTEDESKQALTQQQEELEMQMEKLANEKKYKVTMEEAEELSQRERALLKMVDAVEAKMKMQVVEQMFSDKFGETDSGDFLDELSMELTLSISEQLQENKKQAQKEQEAAKNKKNMQEEEDRRAQAEKLKNEKIMLDEVAKEVAIREKKTQEERMSAPGPGVEMSDADRDEALNNAIMQSRLEIVKKRITEEDQMMMQMEDNEARSNPFTFQDAFSASWAVHDKMNMIKLSDCPTKDVWTMPEVRGDLPIARHEHAAVVANKKMLVIGGRRSGRLMRDVAVLCLETLSWSIMDATCPMDDTETHDFKPTAGHAALFINERVLVLGGLGKHSENEEHIALNVLDLKTQRWFKPTRDKQRDFSTLGPSPRAGFASCKVGKSVWLFGGEDKNRNVLDEVFCLDTLSMGWLAPLGQSGGHGLRRPPPLAYHTAVAYLARYVVMFGGMDAGGSCTGDLYVFDTDTGTWLSPTVMGEAPFPRAGHSACLLGPRMYVVGGGDGCRAVTETTCLNLAAIQEGMLKWEPVTDSTVKAWKPKKEGSQQYITCDASFSASRSPLSSEGLTCVAVPSARGGSVLAFGGSDGNFYNELLVLNPTTCEHANTLDSAKADYIGVPLQKWLQMKDDDEYNRKALASTFKSRQFEAVDEI